MMPHYVHIINKGKSSWDVFCFYCVVTVFAFRLFDTCWAIEYWLVDMSMNAECVGKGKCAHRGILRVDALRVN